jgi:hypothetical protein
METTQNIDTPRAFAEHIRGAPAPDLAGVHPRERETLDPYYGYPDWPPHRGPINPAAPPA